MGKKTMPVCHGTHYCGYCRDWFTHDPKVISSPVGDGDTFKSEFERRFPTLSYDFIQIMNDIGNYGLEKYGEQSMEAKFKRGDFSRFDRTLTREILRHATAHGEEFIDGILHDKFGTSEHQLGAGAFNFMMEYRFRSKK